MTREPLSEEHKATYHRIIAAVSAGDGDALDALVAGDVVDHNPIPDQAPGLVRVKQWMVTARQSFPALRGTVGHVVAEGDLVAGRVSWQGTQAGRFRGFAPTGWSVTFKAYHIVRFGGGPWRGGAPPTSSGCWCSSAWSGPRACCRAGRRSGARMEST